MGAWRRLGKRRYGRSDDGVGQHRSDAGDQRQSNAGHRHGRDDSPYDTTPPDCVVFPESGDEVAEVVRMCARHRVPVIAYGAGTSIEGHI